MVGRSYVSEITVVGLVILFWESSVWRWSLKSDEMILGQVVAREEERAQDSILTNASIEGWLLCKKEKKHLER